jgi:hypothetical protein
MAPAMKRAFPPVALSAKMVIPPGFVIMVVLPAVLALRKERFAWLPTIKVGFVGRIVNDAGTGDVD